MEIPKRELRVLAFDWGDTLMKVFPMPPGPMVDWPEVAAVEGALECLPALHGRYRIVVATNASESSAQEVRGALDRVGLGEFIDEIFTVKEIGTSKLSPVYYSQLEIILGERREHLMMVGDHYTADVLHPWQAGWQAAWFNPAGLAAPGLLPVQSIDLARLADLPEALSSISLPGYMDCLAWYLAREAPQILLRHVETVAAGAYQMALWLRNAGKAVNPILAHRGGLLHDLAKFQADENGGPDHGELAEIRLQQAGQPELATIARRHMLFGLLEEGRGPLTWEQKVVYMADKLVEGSRFATVEARLDALKARYSIEPELMARIEPLLNHLIEEVCAAMDCPVGELAARLQKAARGPLPERPATG